MFVVDRSPNVFISAYASVIGTEPITNEGGTLDFVFFMPQQRRSDHSRPARLAVLGVVFDEKECVLRFGVLYHIVISSHDLLPVEDSRVYS